MMSDTEIRYEIEALREAIRDATDEDERKQLEAELAEAEYWSEER